jgi:hypothetical protein
LWEDYRAAQQSQLGFSLQSAINIHKGNKMSKKFWFMLFSLMLTSLSASALEVNCRWVNIEVSGEGGWRYECDTVPDLPPDDVINGTQPGGGGTATGGGAISVSPETQAKIIAVIKQSKDLCKKESEDCGAWGARMTAPKPIGSGFCTNISAALPLIGTSLCIQAVNIEVNLNYCANVGCP